MAAQPQSPVDDKNYNLIAVLHDSLNYAWQMETYIADAERDGDEELATWFHKIHEGNKKAGEQQDKEMLAKRSSKE